MKLRVKAGALAAATALVTATVIVTGAGSAQADHNNPIPVSALVCEYEVTGSSNLSWHLDHDVNSGVAETMSPGTHVFAFRDHTETPGQVTFRPRPPNSNPDWANAGGLERTGAPCFN